MGRILTLIKNKYKNNSKSSNFLAQKTFAIFALFLLPFLMTPTSSFAVSMGDIGKLDQEISRLNSVIRNKKAEVNTLKNQVSIIDTEIQKIQLEINSTQAKINKLNSEIKAIEIRIGQAEKELEKKRTELSEFIRVMYEEGQVSIVEIMAKSGSFNEFVNRSEYMEQVQLSVKKSADEVIKLKTELETKREQLGTSKKDLGEKKANLVAQQNGVYTKRNERNNLLTRTKGQESAYQKELTSTRKAREAAWADYWASQQGPSSGGSQYGGGAGSGYLMWPSAGVKTQDYGCTSFANCGNPYGPYRGSPHNGIDISCGWDCNIKAAASGVVIRRSSSSAWGKYVIIKHPNGLSTLYAHMSSTEVSTGQTVAKGQTIGYEGDTGFSTGSHLHFSVYTSITLYSSGSFSYGVTTDPFRFL